MKPHEPNPFLSVAHCRGLSTQILFGMDGESKPGKVICHFVRLETIEFDEGDPYIPEFTQLSPKADPRLEPLSKMFTKGADELISALLGLLSENMTALGEVLRLPIAVGTQAMRARWARALTKAAAFLDAGMKAQKSQAHINPLDLRSNGQD